MKIGQAAKDIIGAIAPTLGAALGGPFGALAGRVLTGVLNGDDKSIEKAVLSGDPAALAQVRIAEIEFQKRIEELGLESDKLAYADIASARGREVAVRDKTPAYLAYAVTVGFFGVLVAILCGAKPHDGGDALLVMLGSLGAAWTGIVAYYFGSSVGSKDKTAALAAAATKR
jgi:hypothetical protein